MKIFTSKNNISKKKPLFFEESEIFSELTKKKGTSLFLGKYSVNTILAVLKKNNFLNEAKKRKLWPLDIDLDSSEYPPLQRLQIFHRQKRPENVVVDLKLKKGNYFVREGKDPRLEKREFHLLFLEWLTLQNPLLSFTKNKTALPGQVYPGLSLGKKVFDIFVYLAESSKCDGLLAYPAFFHNALLFSRYFHFPNPEKQGELLVLRKIFSKISFKELAWIVHLNCLRGKNDKVFEWKAEEQIYPLNKLLKKYFNSKEYKEKVKKACLNRVYSIDWASYWKKIESKEQLYTKG